MFTLTIPQSDPFDPIHYKKKQKISNWQSRSNHLEYVLDALGENTVFRTVTLLYAVFCWVVAIELDALRWTSLFEKK
jgi:hypothetical protein